MPSNFIWRSTLPPAKTQIKYYLGSNWSLEDSEINSQSYLFLEQCIISCKDFEDKVIVNLVKNMPSNWVGSQLLEVSHISYEKLKEQTELNKLKYLKLIKDLEKKGAIIPEKVDINMSLTEIIKVYKLSYIEHEDELQKQKLNTLINMGKTILDNIDPEWKIKLEGENVGMTDKLIKEFIKQNTGDSIYEN